MARCEFCPSPPREEAAVLKWRGDERERLTVPLCMKHHARIAKTGARGWAHQGFSWKLGWW